MEPLNFLDRLHDALEPVWISAKTWGRLIVGILYTILIVAGPFFLILVTGYFGIMWALTLAGPLGYFVAMLIVCACVAIITKFLRVWKK